MSEPIGGNSVIVNDSFVPPLPSPAMLAWSEATSVKLGGATVVSEPTIGIGTSTVLVTVPPLPSSKVTSCSTPVTFLTVNLTSSLPSSPTTSPGSTASPSRK